MPVPLRRLLLTTVQAMFAKRSKVGRLRHHVHLSYIDLYMHMNYASYLEVMEIARWNWAFQAGVMREVFYPGYHPVVVKVDINYLRELRAFTRFTVDTRLVAINGKTMDYEQIILVGDRVHARAIVTGLMLYKGKVVDSDKVTELMSPWIVSRLVTDDR
jgi:acyl-CoA thioesterase FadM